jgi:cyclopropane-fatty-acyl-phospholipid synthase
LLVHDENLFTRVLAEGTLGLGEAYMDGWWDCQALDQFFHRVLRARLDDHIHPWRAATAVVVAKVINLQKPSRAYEVGRRHYDIGNALYSRMLDRHMQYSCGYWRGAETLDEAQEAKLDLICRKLRLEPGMRLLDIGCGWGGLLQYAAETYGVTGVGLTVSEQQAALARERCAGLPVEVRLEDYRVLDEPFDRIASVGMFEHVGYKNYRTFMETAHRCLAPDGLLLLHTIGGLRSAATSDPWILKYIFPNSMLPSAAQLAEASEGLFVMEDWHNFGDCYDPTLMAWHRNVEEAWPDLRERYDERFRRMWRYYLLSCAGSFRARRNQLWQVVYSPRGVPGGYDAPR